jgi:hypothetical protein
MFNSMLRCPAGWFAIGCLLAWTGLAEAQSMSRTTSGNRGTSATSAFGGRTLGAGINSPRSQQQGGANTQVGNGQGLQAAQEGAGQLTGNERFLRENRQGAFVGADVGEAVNLRSQMGANAQMQGMRNLQGLFQQLGRGSDLNNQPRGNQQGRAQTQLRIPIRLGFQGRPVVAPQFTAKFQQRLTKLPGLNVIGPIEVTLEGRTAVLRGTVATEADRELAAGLARLEPEVLDVRNELVVGAAATTGEELLPASAASSPRAGAVER